MNDMLLKILERYELDKPILMADKLDIIWDKSKPKDNKSNQKAKDPDAAYQKMLRDSTMSYEDAMIEKQINDAKRKEEIY